MVEGQESRVESQTHSSARADGRLTSGTLRSLLWLGMTLLLFSASGATCQRPLFNNPFGVNGPVAPQVLPEGPSREQIIAAVNQNAARVRSLSATGATITIPDMMGPTLSGNIAAERPGRFRLTAGTASSPARRSTSAAMTNCFGCGRSATIRRQSTSAGTINLPIARSARSCQSSRRGCCRHWA